MAKGFTQNQMKTLDERFEFHGSMKVYSTESGTDIPSLYSPNNDRVEVKMHRNIAVYAKQYIRKSLGPSNSDGRIEAAVFLVPDDGDVHSPSEEATLIKYTEDDGRTHYQVFRGAMEKPTKKGIDDFDTALSQVRDVLLGSPEEKTVAVVDVGSMGKWVKGDLKGDLRSIAGVEITEVEESDHTSQKGGMMSQPVKTGGKTYTFITRGHFNISPDEEDQLYDRYADSEDVEDMIIYT